MSEAYIGEIRMLPYSFSPLNWTSCDGQLMYISQNTALFSLIGSYYGGDARVTMGIPNLKGRSPLHVGGQAGRAPGLSYYSLGDLKGKSEVTLTLSSMPSHDHNVMAAFGSAVNATDQASNAAYLGPQLIPPAKAYQTDVSGTVNALESGAIGASGGSQGHENRQPYLVVPFCLCLFGDYPPRN